MYSKYIKILKIITTLFPLHNITNNIKNFFCKTVSFIEYILLFIWGWPIWFPQNKCLILVILLLHQYLIVMVIQWISLIQYTNINLITYMSCKTRTSPKWPGRIQLLYWKKSVMTVIGFKFFLRLVLKWFKSFCV